MSAGAKFEELVSIMQRLRAPGGCPWDREQTFDTIKPFLLQETYEVMDAIDRRAWNELAGEIGDLLLQAVFFSQMAGEENRFTIEDALTAINDKLVRRHPHVFGEASAQTEADVREIWSKVKEAERTKPEALLDAVPRTLPALVEAEQLSSRAAQQGFDWPDTVQVLAKLDEERAELAACQTPEQREGELGDMFFTLVNLARFMKVDPEQALRRTNAKFRSRFRYVEAQLKARGKTPSGSSLQEMENLWQEAKR